MCKLSSRRKKLILVVPGIDHLEAISVHFFLKGTKGDNVQIAISYNLGNVRITNV
jgi:hypothetical protein